MGTNLCQVGLEISTQEWLVKGVILTTIIQKVNSICVVKLVIVVIVHDFDSKHWGISLEITEIKRVVNYD